MARTAFEAVVTVAAVFVIYELTLTSVVHLRGRDRLISAFAAQDSRAHGGLQIPKIGLNEIVAEGDSDANLRAGPSHRTSTAELGATGNAVVFGHMSRYGGPFGKLSELEPGDEILAKSRTGPLVLYKVVSVSTASANGTRSLAPTTDKRVTLVTSAGRFSTHRRVVVAVADHSGPAVAADTPPAPSPPAGGAGFNPKRGSPLFNAGMGGAYLSTVVAALAFGRLRRRVRPGVAVLTVVPVVVLAAVLAVRGVELMLPSTL